MEPNEVNQHSIPEALTGSLSAPFTVQDIPRGYSDDTSSLKIPFAPTSRDGGMGETNWDGSFKPVSLRTLLDQPVEEVPWVIEGYVAQGRLTLLAGPPKLG